MADFSSKEFRCGPIHAIASAHCVTIDANDVESGDEAEVCLDMKEARAFYDWLGALLGTRETEAKADEVAWLIEFTPFPEPLYLSADGSFDRDHLKAVRFSRKEDGEAMLRYMHTFRKFNGRNDDGDREYTRILHGEDCYHVTEHMWCADSPAKTSIPTGRIDAEEFPEGPL